MVTTAFAPTRFTSSRCFEYASESSFAARAQATPNQPQTAAAATTSAIAAVRRTRGTFDSVSVVVSVVNVHHPGSPSSVARLVALPPRWLTEPGRPASGSEVAVVPPPGGVAGWSCATGTPP